MATERYSINGINWPSYKLYSKTETSTIFILSYKFMVSNENLHCNRIVQKKGNPQICTLFKAILLVFIIEGNMRLLIHLWER